jgi:hypothetical protein
MLITYRSKMQFSQVISKRSGSRSGAIAVLCVVLLFGCLPWATAFRTTTTDASSRRSWMRPPIQTADTIETTASIRHTQLQLNKAYSDETIRHDDDSNKSPIQSKNKPFTVYKDDCFGFTTFLAGIGSRDATFVGIFVVLSLTADFGTRLGWLPPDTKRPSIVDRKVPGAVAGLTLALTPLLTPFASSILSVDIPEPAPAARTLQLAVCSFSMITAFWDIRWRDRFDYPEDFYQKKE